TAAVACTSLASGLWRYVYSGGGITTNSVDYRSTSLFLFALLYNVLRAVLLWKTKNLELQQQSTGIPVRFSFGGIWGRLYFIAHWGFFVNVVIVLLHTLHFFQ